MFVMVKCIIVAKIKDDYSSWDESFITSLDSCSLSAAHSYLDGILLRFNAYLRPHETPRSLVYIISVNKLKKSCVSKKKN